MKVFVNGNERDLVDGLTIAALIGELGLSGPVAVERNHEVVPRAQHGSTSLCEGDRVEIVHFVGGG